MNTLAKNKALPIAGSKERDASVRATNVRFVGDRLYVMLNDGREVGLSLQGVKWLKWLAQATPQERRRWTIEPLGDAIYWDDLDDGIEVCHLLGTQPIAT